MTVAPGPRARERVRRYASVVAWVAFFVVPRSSSGLVDGLPLGPIEAAALLAVGWVFFAGTRLSGARLVVAALGVSLLVSVAVPDRRGLTAKYYASTDTTRAFERSTEYRGRDFTRIDGAIDFEQGHREFPLAFFNDIGRFNFYRPNELRRESLGFAVTWDAHWLVDTEGEPRELYLDAPSAAAQVTLDGASVLSVTPLDAPRTAIVKPSKGWHELHLRFTSPYGSPRRVSVGEVAGGTRVRFGTREVFTTRSEPWRLRASALVRGLLIALDLVVLAWLAALLVMTGVDRARSMMKAPSMWAPGRQWLAWLSLVGLGEALVFATPWASRMMTLVGGDDTLTYEYYARQIQLDSFLLAKDGGEPFFYQVLYPYVLAGVHVMFGESMFGPMLVQRLLLILLVWAVLRIAVRLGGSEMWWSGLACGAAFAYGLMAPVSAKLLNESLFVPLLVAWTAATMSVSMSPTILAAIGTGLLGGVVALTRSTTLLAWAVALPICWWSWKAVPRRGLLIATLLVCSCAVMSLIAARNWIVVHELILMPGELPVTLYGGNEPPPGTVLDVERHRALHDQLGLHPFTRQVIEYALTAPAQFLRNLMRKALFALGYFDLYAPGWGYSIGLLMISVASLAGVALTVRHPASPLWIALLPALIALTQYVAVVMVYPKGMRLILPFHALMVPYAAVTANVWWRRVRGAWPPAYTLAP